MYTVLNVHQNLLKSDCVFSRMQKNEVFPVMMNQTHVDLNLLLLCSVRLISCRMLSYCSNCSSSNNLSLT